MNSTVQPVIHPPKLGVSPPAQVKKGYLFGPWVDFLGLGGGSLIVLALLALFLDPEIHHARLLLIFLLLTNVINHPHFAHSYQIFYRNFRYKLGENTERILRYRYWFAGIIAPLILAAFLTAAVAMNSTLWVGYSVNVMGFLVGWHYVKQGYGMLSVDSVLKRRFFTDGEKKILLWNAYAGWIYSWIYINQIVREANFQGLAYYTIGVPEWLQTASLAVLIVTSIVTLGMFARRLAPGKAGLPLNGVVAYLTSIYVWLIVAQFNPLFLVVIPAFHSLQYLVVVGRFQLNVETESNPDSAKRCLALFYLVGLGISLLGFWLIPIIISEMMGEDITVSGFSMPLIATWIFINIHHYFLDNVMWRKGNPDVGKHLFAHR